MHQSSALLSVKATRTRRLGCDSTNRNAMCRLAKNSRAHADADRRLEHDHHDRDDDVVRDHPAELRPVKEADEVDEDELRRREQLEEVEPAIRAAAADHGGDCSLEAKC